MKYFLGKTSMMFVVSGLVKMAAGIAICLWPITDFTPLIYLFAVPAVLQGIVHITTSFQYKEMYDHWRIMLIEGIIYLAAGAFILSYSEVTPMVLMIAIAATWSLVGIIMVRMSIQLNKESQNEFGLLLSGILSIMAGIYLLTNLNRDVYSVLWILVIYSFLIGILTMVFGIKAKAWHHIYFDDSME